MAKHMANKQLAMVPMNTTRCLWERFAAEYWESASGQFERAFAEPPLPANVAFSAAVALAEAAQQGKAVVEPCVWLDGTKLHNPLPFLPVAADATFDGYGDRVLTQSGAQEFTALFPEPHYYDRNLLTKIRSILLGLTDACGLPSGWTDTALFVGRYRRTPFGIHFGPMSVLTVPIIGRKSFRVWSEEEIARHPGLIGATIYDPTKSVSKLLTAAPGDLIYWPSREWHIAEADDGLTAALSFGFWTSKRNNHPLRQVTKMVERLLAGGAPAASDDLTGLPLPPGIADHPAALPPGWQHSVDALRDLLQSGTLETELFGEHVRLASAFGLKHVPPEPQQPIDPSRAFSLDPLSGLSLARSGDALVVAVYGQAFTLPNDVQLAAMLTDLKLRSLTQADIRRRFAEPRDDALDADDAWAVVEHLATLGAIRPDGYHDAPR